MSKEGRSTKHEGTALRSLLSCFVQFRHCIPDMRRSTSCHLLAACCLCLSGCAGYQIGNQSLYPSHIRTVYVPIFESDSFRPYLGERLTEAVIKEIELKTPYKVVGDAAMADSVLSGKITGETKRVVVQNRYDDAPPGGSRSPGPSPVAGPPGQPASGRPGRFRSRRSWSRSARAPPVTPEVGQSIATGPVAGDPPARRADRRP